MFEWDREKFVITLMLIVIVTGIILSVLFKEKVFLLGASLACFVTQISIAVSNMDS